MLDNPSRTTTTADINIPRVGIKDRSPVRKTPSPSSQITTESNIPRVGIKDRAPLKPAPPPPPTKRDDSNDSYV
jgi:hypothetical protein